MHSTNIELLFAYSMQHVQSLSIVSYAHIDFHVFTSLSLPYCIFSASCFLSQFCVYKFFSFFQFLMLIFMGCNGQEQQLVLFVDWNGRIELYGVGLSDNKLCDLIIIFFCFASRWYLGDVNYNLHADLQRFLRRDSACSGGQIVSRRELPNFESYLLGTSFKAFQL